MGSTTDGASDSSAGRHALRNFGFLTSGTALGDLSVFLLLIVLSRYFGPDGVGSYGLAIGLAGFFVAFADFGLGPFTVREVSQGIGAENLPSRVLTLRTILSAAALLGLALLLPLTGFAPETKRIVLIVGTSQLLHQIAGGMGCILLAWGRPQVDSIATAVSKGTGAVAGIAIAVAGGSLSLTLTPLIAAATIHLWIVLRAVRRRSGALRPALDRSSLVDLARSARPFALSRFLAQIASRTDVLLLGLLVGTTAAGLYHAPHRVVTALFWIPHFAALALLPIMSRARVEFPETLGPFYQRALGSAVLFGIPAMAGLLWIAPGLTVLLFGPEFIPAVPVLRILAVLVLLACLSKIMSVCLLACNREEPWVRHQWKAALVNLVGNLALIPWLGIVGAALATLVAETLLVALFAVELAPIVGPPRIGQRLGAAFLGTSAFSVIFILWPGASLAVTVAVGVVVYCAVIFSFPAIRSYEGRAALDGWRMLVGRGAGEGP
jgi:O-antigen/teichoic acid export membrane protein